MTKYVHYNPTTMIYAGFYDSEVNSSLPDPKIEITDEQHNEFYECLLNHKSFTINGLEIKPEPPIVIPVTWETVRLKRDALLKNTDWTQLPDVPSTLSEKYKSYRQALRDVPQVYSDPTHVMWPSPSDFGI